MGKAQLKAKVDGKWVIVGETSEDGMIDLGDGDRIHKDTYKEALDRFNKFNKDNA